MNKMRIFLLLITLSLTFTFDITVGSYTKTSFGSNDVRINSALNLVKNQITNQNSNSNLSVVPVAIYSQVVNGINYKLIVATKDTTSGKVDLTQSIVYTGPFSENFSRQTPTLTYFQKLSDDNLTVAEDKSIAINFTLTDYLKNSNGSLNSIASIVSYPNLVQAESYFVVNGSVKKSNGSNENHTYIICQNKDQTFTVTNDLTIGN